MEEWQLRVSAGRRRGRGVGGQWGTAGWGSAGTAPSGLRMPRQELALSQITWMPQHGQSPRLPLGTCISAVLGKTCTLGVSSPRESSSGYSFLVRWVGGLTSEDRFPVAEPGRATPGLRCTPTPQEVELVAAVIEPHPSCLPQIALFRGGGGLPSSSEGRRLPGCGAPPPSPALPHLRWPPPVHGPSPPSPNQSLQKILVLGFFKKVLKY